LTCRLWLAEAPRPRRKQNRFECPVRLRGRMRAPSRRHVQRKACLHRGTARLSYPQRHKSAKVRYCFLSFSTKFLLSRQNWASRGSDGYESNRALRARNINSNKKDMSLDNVKTTVKRWIQGKNINQKITLSIWQLTWALSF
jgi:hypothetical protein